MFSQILQGVSAVSSLAGGRRAGRAGARLTRFSQDRLNELAPIATEQSRRGDALWRSYEEHVPGLEDAFVAAAQEGLDPGQEAGRAVADVRQQAAVARGTRDRTLRRYGVNPGSGQYEAGLTDLANAETLASVDAVNSARRRVREDKVGRLGAALGAMRPSANLALAYEGQAAAGLSDAARIGSGMAADASAAAREAGAAAAPGLDAAARWLDDRIFGP